MNNKRKVINILIVFIILFTTINTSYANSLNITSESAVLMDSKTGQILYEKNMDSQRAMASTSKLMTYLLVMEAIDRGEINYNDKVKVSLNASKTGGSSYRLKANEVLTVEELVNSMLIISANDSAVVLAEYVSGNVEEFTRRMNERAVSLDLKSAYFVNPNGMPLVNEDQNKISAKDLAYLSKYIINKYEKHILNITNKKEFNGIYKNTTIKNTNELMINTSYVEGLKTGYTGLAKYCLVSTAKIKNTNNRLISVVLGSQSAKHRASDSKMILDYGLEHYNLQTILEKGESFKTIEEINYKITPLELTVKEDITIFSLHDIDLRKNKEIIFETITDEKIKKGIINAELKLNDGTSVPIQLEVKRSISISINDILIVHNEISPFVKNGVTFVPLRMIAEELGSEVIWDEINKSIIVTKNDTLIKLFINQDIMFVNDYITKMDFAPIVVNGNTMIPIRTLAENLGAKVVWDKENYIVKLYLDK